MKKVLGIIIIFVLVLGAIYPSFGAEEFKEIGRFKIVPARQDTILLLDTVSGQVWLFMSTVKEDGIYAKMSWVPIKFAKSAIYPGIEGVLVEK